MGIFKKPNKQNEINYREKLTKSSCLILKCVRTLEQRYCDIVLYYNNDILLYNKFFCFYLTLVSVCPQLSRY